MNERLESLLSAVPDRGLNPAEETELLTLLRQSPAARQLAARDRWMDRLMRESRRPAINVDLVMRAIDHGRADLADRTMDRLGTRPVGPRRLRVRFADGCRGFWAGLTRRPGWAWAGAVAVLGIVLGLAALGRLNRLPAPVVIGHFTAVVGLPTLDRTSGKPPPLSVRSNAPVHLGDRLETGDADKAEIRFLDGTTLRLGFNTAVTLGSPQTVSRNPQMPVVRPDEVHLLKGQVWTQVQKTTNAPTYAIRTDAATAIARGTEFGVKLARPPSALRLSPFAAVLTVREGVVDFTNAFGSVQATAMTESTATADSAPTEPRRLETLQVVQLSDRVQWSILSSRLDWPDATQRLALGGGWAGFQLLNAPEPNGAGQTIRVSRVHRDGPAAAAGLLVGDALIALDRQALTEPGQVGRHILLRPGQPVELTVRRNETERIVSLTPLQRPPVLPGPDLSEEQARVLSELTRPWMERGLDPDESADSPSRARGASMQAAAENDRGVLLEGADALGPAIRAYGRAVCWAPEVALYRFNLGLALRKIGSFERAAEELAAAVALAPASAEALKRLAEVHSLLGANDLALQQTEAALQADPADHGLLELKAQVLSRLGRDRQATEAARAAVALDPDCAVAHGLLGRTLFQEGNLAEAEAAYRRAMELTPFEAVCHLNLGSILMQRGQARPAEQSFKRAIALRPDFVLAHRTLGNLLAAGRRWSEATEILVHAAALDPDDAGILRELGNLQLSQGQLDAAEAWFHKALGIVPHDAESQARLGRIHAMRGDLAGAERWLRQARVLAPGDSGIHNDLGEVFRLGGRLDEAAECYRRAIDLDPGNLDARNNLAIVHLARGEHAEAERLLRALVERASSDRRVNPLNFLANLAIACAKQGKLAEAERFHRQALALAPNDAGLWNNLASFLAEHRLNLNEALSLARRAVQVAPRDADFLDTLGWVHFQRGEFEEAEGFLRRALELVGDGPSAAGIREHLQQLQQTRAPDPN